MKQALYIALVLAILSFSTSGYGQTPDDGASESQDGASESEPEPVGTVEPTDAQLELNETAVSASLSGDHATAVELFRASLELGALNITYLNLGRAHAALDRCGEAEKAYKAARKAPPVADPPPDQIDQLVDKYLVELHEGCIGTLLLTCSPRNMEVSIDDAEPITCPEQPMELTWGAHQLIWGPEDDPRKARVHIEPNAETELHLDHPRVEVVEVPVETPPEPVEPAESSNWMLIAGASTAGAGALLLVGGLIVDTGVTGSTIDDYEAAAAEGDQGEYDSLRGDIDTLQTTSIALYATGGILVAGGATLLILHFLQDEPDEIQPAVHVDPGSGAASVGFTTRF